MLQERKRDELHPSMKNPSIEQSPPPLLLVHTMIRIHHHVLPTSAFPDFQACVPDRLQFLEQRRFPAAATVEGCSMSTGSEVSSFSSSEAVLVPRFGELGEEEEVEGREERGRRRESVERGRDGSLTFVEGGEGGVDGRLCFGRGRGRVGRGGGVGGGGAGVDVVAEDGEGRECAGG